MVRYLLITISTHLLRIIIDIDSDASRFPCAGDASNQCLEDVEAIIDIRSTILEGT